MEYEDRVTLSTPKGVELQLTLAGIGSRMIAALFDLTIQVVAYIVFLLATRGSDIGIAILAVIAFALVFGYDVSFEVLGGGRTPGKRVAGLRVVRASGRRVDFVTSAIRNSIRVIDYLPTMYAFGMLSVLLSPKNQRLGDLAAGTLVVRERLGGRKRRRRAAAAAVAAPAFLPPGPGIAASWDVSAVSASDLATVRAFLARRSSLDSDAADSLAADIAARLRPLVAGAPETLPAEKFLELLSAAKSAR